MGRGEKDIMLHSIFSLSLRHSSIFPLCFPEPVVGAGGARGRGRAGAAEPSSAGDSMPGLCAGLMSSESVRRGAAAEAGAGVAENPAGDSMLASWNGRLERGDQNDAGYM